MRVLEHVGNAARYTVAVLFYALALPFVVLAVGGAMLGLVLWTGGWCLWTLTRPSRDVCVLVQPRGVHRG